MRALPTWTQRDFVETPNAEVVTHWRGQYMGRTNVTLQAGVLIVLPLVQASRKEAASACTRAQEWIRCAAHVCLIAPGEDGALGLSL